MNYALHRVFLNNAAELKLSGSVCVHLHYLYGEGRTQSKYISSKNRAFEVRGYL